MKIQYYFVVFLSMFIFFTLSCDKKNEQYSEIQIKEKTTNDTLNKINDDNKKSNDTLNKTYDNNKKSNGTENKTTDNNKNTDDINGNKPKVKSDNFIFADVLLSDYLDNQIRANNKYQYKRISIKGKISKITKSPTDYTLIEIVAAKFSTTFIKCALLHSEDKKALQLSKGDEIIILGKCSGKLDEYSDIYFVDCKLK